jgi:hypothetical protein
MEAKAKITALSVAVGVLILGMAGVVYYYAVYQKKEETALLPAAEDTTA